MRVTDKLDVRYRTASIVALATTAWFAIVAPAIAQRNPQTALLEAAGFAALDVGDARRAADAFREVLTVDPNNATLHLGAGVAALLERRDGDARTAFERALALSPSLLAARLLLGQVLRR